MVGSSVDPSEVLGDGSLNLLTLFEYFRLAVFVQPLHLRDDWVVPFDPQDLVGDLVELLHPPIPQQTAKFLEVLRLFKLTSNRKLLLLLLSLVTIVVPHRFVFVRLQVRQLPSLVFKGLNNRLFRDVLIGWLSYRGLRVQHVSYCGFRDHQVPDLSLRELEVRPQIEISKLVSLS